jgi:hypothetical protein
MEIRDSFKESPSKGFIESRAKARTCDWFPSIEVRNIVTTKAFPGFTCYALVERINGVLENGGSVPLWIQGQRALRRYAQRRVVYGDHLYRGALLDFNVNPPRTVVDTFTGPGLNPRTTNPDGIHFCQMYPPVITGNVLDGSYNAHYNAQYWSPRLCWSPDFNATFFQGDGRETSSTTADKVDSLHYAAIDGGDDGVVGFMNIDETHESEVNIPSEVQALVQQALAEDFGPLWATRKDRQVGFDQYVTILNTQGVLISPAPDFTLDIRTVRNHSGDLIRTDTAGNGPLRPSWPYAVANSIRYASDFASQAGPIVQRVQVRAYEPITYSLFEVSLGGGSYTAKTPIRILGEGFTLGRGQVFEIPLPTFTDGFSINNYAGVGFIINKMGSTVMYIGGTAAQFMAGGTYQVISNW